MHPQEGIRRIIALPVRLSDLHNEFLETMRSNNHRTITLTFTGMLIDCQRTNAFDVSVRRVTEFEA